MDLIHICLGTFLLSIFTMRPGTPTTVQFGGTSSSTTEPAPTLGILSDCKRTDDLRSCADHNIVFQRRVALSLFFSGSPESDALIKGDIVSDESWSLR